MRLRHLVIFRNDTFRINSLDVAQIEKQAMCLSYQHRFLQENYFLLSTIAQQRLLVEPTKEWSSSFKYTQKDNPKGATHHKCLIECCLKSHEKTSREPKSSLCPEYNSFSVNASQMTKPDLKLARLIRIVVEIALVGGFGVKSGLERGGV